MIKKTCSNIITLLLTLISTFVWSQIKVKGRVTDSDRNSLPETYIEGENGQNTETDANGRYTIMAKKGEKLTFSFIGNDDIIKRVTRDVVNVTFKKKTNKINNVVVTAFGLKRKQKALGYGVSKVSSEDIEKSNEQNLVEALAGKAAGVQINGSGGTPGASSKIIIRGKKSITLGSNPIIIIDGLRIDNSTNQPQQAIGDYPYNTNLQGINVSNRLFDINPDDIASVSILKGPAAAALYGEGAGNGVIIYTTKRGRKGKRIGIDFRTNTSFASVSKLPKMQHTYAAGDGGKFIPPANPGPDKLYGTNDDISRGTPDSWGPNAKAVGIPLYDNLKNFFKTGVTQDYNLALSGGSKKTSFRVSIGHSDQQGIIPNSEQKRTSVRITADSKLLDYLKVGATISYSRTSGKKVQNGSSLAGIMLGLLRAPQSYDLRDYTDKDTGYQKTYYLNYDNPFYSAYKNPFTSEVNRAIGSTYITYNPKDYFNITLRSGWDVYSDFRRQVYAISSLADKNSSGKGQVNYDNILSKMFNMTLLFNGKVNLLKHYLDLSYTGGLDIHSRFYDEVFSRGNNLSVGGLYNLSNAANPYNSNYQERKITQGIFAQAMFDFKDRLFLTVSARRDQTSTFDAKPFYPSASLSWIASNTFNLPSWIDLLKLRYGYAESGLSPVPYSSQTFYLPFAVADGYTTGLSSPYIGRVAYGIHELIGNENLKPERLLGHEAGLELSLFKKRITLNTSYYNQISKDVLLSIPLAPSSGFGSYYANGAEITNKGVEVDLGLDLLRLKDFKWNITANFAKNENEVVKLANGVKETMIESGFRAVRYFAVVGQPLGVLYGTKWKRDDKGDLIIGSDGLPKKSKKEGVIGSPAPKWTAGLRNTFIWKNLTLSALLDIRNGGDIWNGTYARLNTYGATDESAANRNRKYIIPGVKVKDPSAKQPEYIPNTQSISARDYFSDYLGDGGGAAEQFVQDGGWVRLRDVSLAYRVKKLKHIQYMEFSISGRNLWLNTKYKGVDPETSLTGAGSQIDGLDFFNNPGTKSYSFGIKVGF